MIRFLSTLSLLVLLGVLPACARVFGGAEQSSPAELSGLGKVHLYYVPTETDPEGLRFHVFRGESIAGPFERVTPEPVMLPADTTAGEPARVWTDYGLPLGSHSYYYLQELRPDGTVRKATAVGRSHVNIPLQRADAAFLEERGERGI